MEFSLVNGQRHEAQPNLSGKCQVCDQPAVAKCGEVKIWHWAHKDVVPVIRGGKTKPTGIALGKENFPKIGRRLSTEPIVARNT
jgi:competence protein CoiA